MKSYSFPMISEGIDFGNGLAGDVQHVAPKEDAHDAAVGIGNAYGAGERSVKAIEALSGKKMVQFGMFRSGAQNGKKSTERARLRALTGFGRLCYTCARP